MNLVTRPTHSDIVLLHELKPGEVFYFATRSYPAACEAREFYIRGGKEHPGDARIPIMGVVNGEYSSHLSGTKVIPVKATLNIEP